MDKTNGRVNWLQFYIHRYLRISGVYAMVIGFFATLYKYMGFGLNTFYYNTVEACRKYWWRNLLYINIYGEDANQSCDYSSTHFTLSILQ